MNKIYQSIPESSSRNQIAAGSPFPQSEQTGPSNKMMMIDPVQIQVTPQGVDLFTNGG